MEIQRSSDGASSSSTAAVDKYDVFINHRGEVKKNFAGHLYRALLSGGLRPFLDQQDLQEGLPFPSQLEAVIRNASVHVAVFSPKYAESRWCLDELLLMRQSGAPIIPVFYHVNPADLRWTDQNKTGVYATSLHELEMKKTSDPQTREEKLRYDPATIQNWRDALSFVADITGFDLNGKFNGDEVHMIDKIVECVGKVIRKPGLYVAKHPTGLNDKVTDFEATVLKQQQAGKIQVAGIVGLGGMGKTTLALELFNRISSKYNKSLFLSDVREKANKTSLHSVQRELLRGLTQGLPEREVDINSIYEGIGMFKKHLKSAHVLLILDDIDHDNQLEALLPVKDVLSPDSFILITSRDKDVLKRSRVEELCIYKLTGLPRQYSQLLFCSYAFCQTNPLHGFENLVDQFLQVCDGLPLALKVLGALLFGKPESYWDAKLNESKVQMKVSPDIKKGLKISYDALSEEEQKIFLDIALFFIGESKTSAITVWNASGWNGLLGLTNLEGKCLVEVDDKNVIHMHDQLRDLGRQIAEEETPRRLWRPTGDIDEWLHKYSSVLTEARGIWLLAEGHRTKRLGNRVILKLRNWLENISYCFLRRDVMNFQLVVTEGHLLDRILRVHSPNLSWLSKGFESGGRCIENIMARHIAGTFAVAGIGPVFVHSIGEATKFFRQVVEPPQLEPALVRGIEEAARFIWQLVEPPQLGPVSHQEIEEAARFFRQLVEPPQLGPALLRQIGEAARFFRQLVEPPHLGPALLREIEEAARFFRRLVEPPQLGPVSVRQIGEAARFFRQLVEPPQLGPVSVLQIGEAARFFRQLVEPPQLGPALVRQIGEAARFFGQLVEPPQLGPAWVRQIGEAARFFRQLVEPPQVGPVSVRQSGEAARFSRQLVEPPQLEPGFVPKIGEAARFFRQLVEPPQLGPVLERHIGESARLFRQLVEPPQLGPVWVPEIGEADRFFRQLVEPPQLETVLVLQIGEAARFFRQLVEPPQVGHVLERHIGESARFFRQLVEPPKLGPVWVPEIGEAARFFRQLVEPPQLGPVWVPEIGEAARFFRQLIEPPQLETVLVLQIGEAARFFRQLVEPPAVNIKGVY